MVKPMTLLIILLTPLAIVYGIGAFTMWDMTWPLLIAEFRAEDRFLIIITYTVVTAVLCMGLA